MKRIVSSQSTTAVRRNDICIDLSDLSVTRIGFKPEHMHRVSKLKRMKLSQPHDESHFDM